MSLDKSVIGNKNIVVDFKPQAQTPQKFSSHKFDDTVRENSQHTAVTAGSDGFFNPQDERPIRGNNSGQYDFTGYQDAPEMEIVDDYNETDLADRDDDLLETVVERYKQIIDEKIELQSARVLESEEEVARKEHEAITARNNERVDFVKN